MELNRQTIRRIAMEQSAIDAGCRAEDFLLQENVIVSSKADPGARKYLKLPFACNLISYGSNVVATIDERFREPVKDYLERFPAEHCFETPNLHVLDDAFRRYGYRVCFMAEYFLPEPEAINAPVCGYELRILTAEDFTELYRPEWSNALCESRKELDVLGVGAFDRGRLIGLAGCSADCETMWQIGVDVLPEYRRQGIASAMTGRLAGEVLERGIVPFYCCAWSNIASARNAIRSGFRPAWAEMTVRETQLVEEMNRGRNGSEDME